MYLWFTHLQSCYEALQIWENSSKRDLKILGKCIFGSTKILVLKN